MSDIRTIKGLCEFFWRVEDKYNLLYVKTGGVRIWQYKRMALYYQFAQKMKILEKPHAPKPHNVVKKKLRQKFFNYLIMNPFAAPVVDVAIFPHPRTKKIEGEYVDIYTHFFLKKLKKSNVKYMEFRRAYLGGEHRGKYTKNVKYLDFILLLTRYVKYFFYVTIDKDMLYNLSDEIKSTLGIEIDISKYFINASKQFNAEFFLYYFLFKKIKCKQIYLVIGSDSGSIISAAKKLNIEVNEFQHGTFSKYHLGYSFPNFNKDLEYFPDKFLVWNDFWKNMIPLPIKNKNIIVHGFDYIDNVKHKYKNISKEKNSVIIISQGAIGDKIAKAVLNNFDYFKEMNVYYKLHPGEYERWDGYVFLSELLKYENVKLLLDVDLYEILARVEYQVGVFSTTLYEGVEFNCKTILLNLPGLEYMDKFISLYKPKIM